MNAHPSNIDTQLHDVSETRTDEPPMYRVILYNDDFTPKAFVVEILVTLFHKGVAEATTAGALLRAAVDDAFAGGGLVTCELGGAAGTAAVFQAVDAALETSDAR